jgi:transposase
MPSSYPPELRRQVVELARSGTRVALLAETFGMSAVSIYNWSESGYYAWKDRPDPLRTLRRIWLAGEIDDVHKASGGTYGANRVQAELRYGRGIRVGHNAVGLIMRELGIKGTPTRRLPKGARVAMVTSLDLVRRVCARDRPNVLWVTDITEHPTNEGKIYGCVVLDTFSGLVAGWAIDSTQTTALVLNALGMATQRRRQQEPLKRTGHVPAVLNRPHPISGLRPSPLQQIIKRSSLGRGSQVVDDPAGCFIDRRHGVRRLVRVCTDHDHQQAVLSRALH